MILITQHDFETKIGQEKIVKAIHDLEYKVHELDKKLHDLSHKESTLEQDIVGGQGPFEE